MSRRAVTLCTMLGGVMSVVATTGTKPAPRYIWNASESIPLGLYRVRPADTLAVSDLVVVQAPEPVAAFLAANGYLPRGVPMLKHVLALPGQSVCRDGLLITVDGIAVGPARERDSRNRPLPTWSGCRVVATDEVFLMNWDAPDSLDGRYFGPLKRSAIIDQAVPVWTIEKE